MSFPRLQNMLTVPNLLSLARVPLGGLFWLAIGPRGEVSYAAFAIMAVAALTDVLDGYLARREAARQAGGVDALIGSGGGTGAWLDPICDKLFVASVLGAIVVRRQPPIGLVLLIVTRELVQLPIGVVYRFLPTLRSWLRYDFRASPLGKAATVAQFAAIAALMLAHPWFRLFAFLSFGLGLAAVVDYFRRAIAMGRARLREQNGRRRSPG
jgi:phosphatidylglycerophosphate synthase